MDQQFQYVKDLSRADLEALLIESMVHLRSVSGSRNSFDFSKPAVTGPFGGMPQRSPAVEAMHHRAVQFLQKHDR